VPIVRCGRFQVERDLEIAFGVTSTTSSYQDLRGFLRKLLLDLPISIVDVHLTCLM